MKTHLTPFQLFFVTFLYVFSGLSLMEASSLFSLLIPVFMTAFWALIAYRGAAKRRVDFSDFLSAYLPQRETSVPLAFFLFVSAVDAVKLLFDAGISLKINADFVPFSLILGVLFGIALLVCRCGVTVLGRLAESSLFLLVPLVFLHLFGDFEPIVVTESAPIFQLMFSVLPSPIFFLLAMTTVSGDAGISQGFQATGTPPKARAAFLVKTVTAASLTAVLLKLMMLVLPFSGNELFLYFLEFTAHITKLSLLFSVCAHGMKKRSGAIYVMLMAAAGVFTLAVAGGAVFSPFLWILLLVFLNLTVGAMMGIFSLK